MPQFYALQNKTPLEQLGGLENCITAVTVQPAKNERDTENFCR
jgi:hypothetical protein